MAARYGGEELCLILPHTDLEGTYVIAERVRESIEAAEIPLIGSEGDPSDHRQLWRCRDDGR